MKKNKKSSGFFIIEILIVLVIVGILIIAMMPNFTTYTQRAKFVDVLSAADAVRPSVDACILFTGTLTNCNTGSYGIPNTPGAAGNFQSYTVAAAVISANSTSTFGTASPPASNFTYVLTPTQLNGAVTWAASGTCQAQGLC